MGSYNSFLGRLILDGAREGSFNMAADLFSAEKSQRDGIPLLRLYSWQKPTVSLGYHQKLPDEIARQCDRIGVPIVRRPTGGRAVLHDNEITYCLTIPREHPLFNQDRGSMQRSIGEILVNAADKAGLKANLARAGSRAQSGYRSRRNGSPLCFDAISRWEVQLNNSKWIGSAQRFFPGIFLQHGSIKIGSNSIDPSLLFMLKNTAEGTEISIELAKCRNLWITIPDAFSETWNLQWQEALFSREEESIIESQADKFKYMAVTNVNIRNQRDRKSWRN